MQSLISVSCKLKISSKQNAKKDKYLYGFCMTSVWRGGGGKVSYSNDSLGQPKSTV